MRILRGFLKNEELGLGGGQPLRLEDRTCGWPLKSKARHGGTAIVVPGKFDLCALASDSDCAY